MFDFIAGVESHMPFAAPDPASGFSPREFCCMKIGGVWKIHQFRNGAWRRVNTGLPDDMTECGPVAESVDGIWHLTFIAGGSERSRTFKLYHIGGLDEGNLPVAVTAASSGFIMKSRLVYAPRSGPVTVEEPGRTMRIRFGDAEYIYRVSYDPFHPARLLVSGQSFNGDIFSRLYDMTRGELFDLEADGEPAYKAALWKDRCFYAKRIGANFEDRRVVAASVLRKRRLEADIFLTIETETNGRSAAMEEL